MVFIESRGASFRTKDYFDAFQQPLSIGTQMYAFSNYLPKFKVDIFLIKSALYGGIHLTLFSISITPLSLSGCKYTIIILICKCFLKKLKLFFKKMKLSLPF